MARLRVRWVAVLLALGAGPAWAECRDANFTEPAVQAATVRPGVPRVHFLREAPPCPDASVVCRARGFVVPGDVVLLAPATGGFACAAFAQPGKMATIGLLPADSVSLTANDAPALGAWVGRWRLPERTIVIAPTPSGGLRLRGDATWGAEDPARVQRGGVNIGEFDATVAAPGREVAFTAGETTRPYEAGSDTDCRIRMVLRGPYLSVEDNLGCGGMNVTFSDIYRRAP